MGSEHQYFFFLTLWDCSNSDGFPSLLEAVYSLVFWPLAYLMESLEKIPWGEFTCKMPDLFLYGPFLQEKGSLCSGFLGCIWIPIFVFSDQQGCCGSRLIFLLCFSDAPWELANALKGKHGGHLGFTHCVSLFSRILAPKVLAAFVTLLWLQTAVFCNIFSFYSCSQQDG